MKSRNFPEQQTKANGRNVDIPLVVHILNVSLYIPQRLPASVRTLSPRKLLGHSVSPGPRSPSMLYPSVVLSFRV